MKTKISYSLLKNLFTSFFLFEKKFLNINNDNAFFCMLQHNREIKQLIKLLSVSQIKSSKKTLKLSLVVFHVEDLVVKNLLTSLINQFNLKIKVQTELVGSMFSQQLSTGTTTLNIYFIEKKTLSSLSFKHRPLNVVFNSCENSFKINYSGCYSVGLPVFDVKLLIFIVVLLNSFLTKDYEKDYKI